MVVASTAAIIKDKKILLIKRSEYTTTFPNHWRFPGGRAESQESPEETVIREAKEEVNLTFEPTELLNTSHYNDRELFRFFGSWSGEVQIQEEEISD